MMQRSTCSFNATWNLILVMYLTLKQKKKKKEGEITKKKRKTTCGEIAQESQCIDILYYFSHASPFLSTHRANGTRPFRVSSRPTTAQSPTAGCSSTDCKTHTHIHTYEYLKEQFGKPLCHLLCNESLTSSNAPADSLWPATLMTSSDRDMM